MKRMMIITACAVFTAATAFAETNVVDGDIAKELAEIGLQAYRTGCRYAHGKGVERDLKKAFECYLLGAEAGYVRAEAAVATCYWNGEGTRRDYKNAAYWEERAAMHGNSCSMFSMGIMRHFGFDGNTNCYEACGWFRLAAENGYGDPKFEPDMIEEEGCGPDVSLRWILSAAELGNSNALYWLAVCYRRGRGVERDKEISDNLMMIAADKGSSLAKCIVGCDMWCGRISGSRDEGLALVREAEGRGNITAYQHLEKLDTTGSL